MEEIENKSVDNIYGDIDDAEIFSTNSHSNNYNVPSQQQNDDSHKQIKALQETLAKEQKKNELLEMRISELYVTAKAEIERKDQHIREIKMENENMIFRRNNHNQYNRSDKTRFPRQIIERGGNSINKTIKVLVNNENTLRKDDTTENNKEINNVRDQYQRDIVEHNDQEPSKEFSDNRIPKKTTRSENDVPEKTQVESSVLGNIYSKKYHHGYKKSDEYRDKEDFRVDQKIKNQSDGYRQNHWHENNFEQVHSEDLGYRNCDIKKHERRAPHYRSRSSIRSRSKSPDRDRRKYSHYRGRSRSRSPVRHVSRYEVSNSRHRNNRRSRSPSRERLNINYKNQRTPRHTCERIQDRRYIKTKDSHNLRDKLLKYRHKVGEVDGRSTTENRVTTFRDTESLHSEEEEIKLFLSGESDLEDDKFSKNTRNLLDIDNLSESRLNRLKQQISSKLDVCDDDHFVEDLDVQHGLLDDGFNEYEDGLIYENRYGSEDYHKMSGDDETGTQRTDNYASQKNDKKMRDYGTSKNSSTKDNEEQNTNKSKESTSSKVQNISLQEYKKRNALTTQESSKIQESIQCTDVEISSKENKEISDAIKAIAETAEIDLYTNAVKNVNEDKCTDIANKTISKPENLLTSTGDETINDLRLLSPPQPSNITANKETDNSNSIIDSIDNKEADKQQTKIRENNSDSNDKIKTNEPDKINKEDTSEQSNNCRDEKTKQFSSLNNEDFFKIKTNRRVILKRNIKSVTNSSDNKGKMKQSSKTNDQQPATTEESTKETNSKDNENIIKTKGHFDKTQQEDVNNANIKEILKQLSKVNDQQQHLVTTDAKMKESSSLGGNIVEYKKVTKKRQIDKVQQENIDNIKNKEKLEQTSKTNEQHPVTIEEKTNESNSPDKKDIIKSKKITTKSQPNKDIDNDDTATTRKNTTKPQTKKIPQEKINNINNKLKQPSKPNDQHPATTEEETKESNCIDNEDIVKTKKITIKYKTNKKQQENKKKSRQSSKTNDINKKETRILNNDDKVKPKGNKRVTIIDEKEYIGETSAPEEGRGLATRKSIVKLPNKITVTNKNIKINDKKAESANSDSKDNMNDFEQLNRKQKYNDDNLKIEAAKTLCSLATCEQKQTVEMHDSVPVLTEPDYSRLAKELYLSDTDEDDISLVKCESKESPPTKEQKCVILSDIPLKLSQEDLKKLTVSSGISDSLDEIKKEVNNGHVEVIQKNLKVKIKESSLDTSELQRCLEEDNQMVKDTHQRQPIAKRSSTRLASIKHMEALQPVEEKKEKSLKIAESAKQVKDIFSSAIKGQQTTSRPFPPISKHRKSFAEQLLDADHHVNTTFKIRDKNEKCTDISKLNESEEKSGESRNSRGVVEPFCNSLTYIPIVKDGIPFDSPNTFISKKLASRSIFEGNKKHNIVEKNEDAPQSPAADKESDNEVKLYEKKSKKRSPVKKTPARKTAKRRKNTEEEATQNKSSWKIRLTDSSKKRNRGDTNPDESKKKKRKVDDEGDQKLPIESLEDKLKTEASTELKVERQHEDTKAEVKHTPERTDHSTENPISSDSSIVMSHGKPLKRITPKRIGECTRQKKNSNIKVLFAESSTTQVTEESTSVSNLIKSSVVNITDSNAIIETQPPPNSSPLASFENLYLQSNLKQSTVQKSTKVESLNRSLTKIRTTDETEFRDIDIDPLTLLEKRDLDNIIHDLDMSDKSMALTANTEKKNNEKTNSHDGVPTNEKRLKSKESSLDFRNILSKNTSTPIKNQNSSMNSTVSERNRSNANASVVSSMCSNRSASEKSAVQVKSNLSSDSSGITRSNITIGVPLKRDRRRRMIVTIMD